MSADKRTLRECVQHLAGTHENDFVSVADAEVISYDIPSRTCEVTLIDSSKPTTRDDVRLIASVDDGILFLPTVGSTVTIIFSTFTQPVVIGWGQVDGIILNGGDLAGLVLMLPTLKSLNQLENDVNSLKSILSSWVPISGDGGAALKTALSNYFSNKLTVTKRSDIENTSITQG